MITAFQAAANGVSALANHSIAAGLVLGDGAQHQQPWFQTARADADGVASIHATIPSGLVVRSGTDLCMGKFDLTSGGTIEFGFSTQAYGFLAPDK